jgi:hypothetical protein
MLPAVFAPHSRKSAARGFVQEAESILNARRRLSSTFVALWVCDMFTASQPNAVFQLNADGRGALPRAHSWSLHTRRAQAWTREYGPLRKYNPSSASKRVVVYSMRAQCVLLGTVLSCTRVLRKHVGIIRQPDSFRDCNHLVDGETSWSSGGFLIGTSSIYHSVYVFAGTLLCPSSHDSPREPQLNSSS